MRMKLKSGLARIITAAAVAFSTLLTMPSALSASAEEGKCGTSTTWSYSNGILTISGSGTVSTTSWSYLSSKITSLVVSDGVTTIPTAAFKSYPALKSVKISSTVNIVASSAFEGCSALTSVELPSTMSEIRSNVFMNCTALKTITLPSKLQTISSGAFGGCLNLQSIDIPSSVTTIGDKAFMATGLQSVTLHEGLQSIGSQAFGLSCFPIVTIPSTVTKIGDGAFGQAFSSIINEGGLFYGTHNGSVVYVTIYGKSGTAAESYAKSAGLKFHEGTYVEHTCSGTWVTESLSTCVTHGKRYYICAVCGEKYYEELPLGGHTMGEWKVTKAPTCTASGIETSTCIYCSKSETREVAATGHSMGSWLQTKAPTCTEDGVETCKCDHCSYSETRKVAATGHSMGSWVQTKAPTCTEDGVETCKCDHCSHSETRAVSATGHRWNEWSLVKAATFTETGLEKRVCLNCKFEETRDIPILESYTVSASCSSGGTISPLGDTLVGVGKSLTIEFSPSDGYEISDVKVDNVSVGKISTYTFYSVLTNHSIHVDFEKIPIIDCCSNIIITPKEAYWQPNEQKFDINDFTITAKIVSGDQITMLDITKNCKAKDTPQSLYNQGKYGVVKLSFSYSGRNEAVQTYLKTNEIADVVTIAYKGDANFDGIINADDSCMALSAYVNTLTGSDNDLTPAQFALLNIIPDARIDADDATAILRYYVSSLIGSPSWDS